MEPSILHERRDSFHTGKIIQMYVRSAYSGRKVGLTLVKTVIDAAFKSADIDQIILGVREGNISERVYEKAGFLTETAAENRAGGKSDGYRRMILRRGCGGGL